MSKPGMFFPSQVQQPQIQQPQQVPRRPLPPGPVTVRQPSSQDPDFVVSQPPPRPVSPLPLRKNIPESSALVRPVSPPPTLLNQSNPPRSVEPVRQNDPVKLNKLMSNLSELFERFNDINIRINCCNTDIQSFEYKKPRENEKQFVFLGIYTKIIQDFTISFNKLYNDEIKNYITELYEIQSSQNETRLKSAINDLFNGNKDEFNNIVKYIFNHYISIIDMYISVYVNLSREMIKNGLPYYILDKQVITNRDCKKLGVSPFNCFEQIANQGIIRFKLAFNELGKILKEFNLNDITEVTELSKILDQKIEIAQVVIDYTASQQSIQKITTLNESDNPINIQIKKQLDKYFYNKFGNFEIKAETRNQPSQVQASSISDTDSDTQSSTESQDSSPSVSPRRNSGIFSNLFKPKQQVSNQQPLDDLVFTRSP